MPNFMRNQKLSPTHLQIIRQKVDVPRIQKSSNDVRWFQVSNSFAILFHRTGKIPLAVQVIAVLFENFGQSFRIVLIALGYPHGNVVQILLEQQTQFALQILFIQMEHFFAGCYNETCTEFHQNCCGRIDGRREHDELIRNINDSQYWVSAKIESGLVILVVGCFRSLCTFECWLYFCSVWTQLVNANGTIEWSTFVHPKHNTDLVHQWCNSRRPKKTYELIVTSITPLHTTIYIIPSDHKMCFIQPNRRFLQCTTPCRFACFIQNDFRLFIFVLQIIYQNSRIGTHKHLNGFPALYELNAGDWWYSVG